MQVSADDASSVVFSVPAKVRVETAAPTAVVEVAADVGEVSAPASTVQV